MPRTISCALALLLAGCSGEEVSSERSSAQPPTVLEEPGGPGLASANHYCLYGADLGISDLRTREDLWEIQRHYLICEGDAEAAESVLRALIARGDTDAQVELAVMLLNTGSRRREAAALLDSASRAGNARADAIREELESRP